MVVDQVLPDGHGIAPAAEGLGDQFAVGLASAPPPARGRDGSPDTGAPSPVSVPADAGREKSVHLRGMAGLAGRVEGRPRPRTTTPAAFR